MYILKAVGVFSLGKIMCSLHAMLGLISVPILVAGIMRSMSGGKGEPLAEVGALVVAIFFPVLCGLVGFVVGTIGALLYNLFAKWLGGIELQIQPVTELVTTKL